MQFNIYQTQLWESLSENDALVSGCVCDDNALQLSKGLHHYRPKQK